MVYESVLLFGVVMLTGLLYAGLTQQRHALQGQWGLRIFLFVVLGSYFVWFWTHGGQTLPMKTWHIRLTTADGEPLPYGRALLRYLLCWLWVMPALGLVYIAGLSGAWTVFTCLLAGVLGYAALVWLHPSRQFWHDIVCGTRLIDIRPPARAARA